MLRVLQHIKFFRTTHGGMERVVEDLVPELNGRPDLEADVLCQGPERRQYALAPRGTVYQVRSDFAFSNASLSWQDLRTWQRIAPRYDIVHVHAPWPQSDLNLLLSHYDGAVVVHWHRDIVRQRKLYALYRPLERWLLRRADRICVTSPKLLAESAALEGFRDKAMAIPIGTGEAAHAIGEDEAAALRARHAGRALVFALGRLVPYKGFEYLVRSAAELSSNGQILIAGEGPLRRDLESLIEALAVHDRVRLLGSVTDREVELYMRACDVFCLPSADKSEAFGIVQVEAMRAARPVVSTRIHGSGIDWVNQDGVTGLTVEPCRPHDLAHALNRLLDDGRLARTLGENGRRRFEELFTTSRMARQVREMYLSLRH
ncbi:MAG: glycosyltransferase [Betaproteobacteria bacterium]|nr:glycosyltransferase [Betaproteobacteria bacterium]MDH5220480.1 glycosyltransferase [Betaproteobacteria bacterium]MDH5350181.1 glycosyltransferase [Betaproteobacteria bacterium]